MRSRFPSKGTTGCSNSGSAAARNSDPAALIAHLDGEDGAAGARRRARFRASVRRAHFLKVAALAARVVRQRGHGRGSPRGHAATGPSKIDNPVQVGQNTATSQPLLPNRRRSLRKGPMEEAPATLEAVDIAAILKALPHRYPFLMV